VTASDSKGAHSTLQIARHSMSQFFFKLIRLVIWFLGLQSPGLDAIHSDLEEFKVSFLVNFFAFSVAYSVGIVWPSMTFSVRFGSMAVEGSLAAC
jgi:ATP/ADP translocase